MPDYALPQLQNPDIIGAMLRGQQGAFQQANGIQDLQLGQQKGILNQQAIQQGQIEQQMAPLKLQQLQLMLRRQQMGLDAADRFLGGAQSAPSLTGGVQSGPQASVSGPRPMPGAIPAIQPGQSPLDAIADPGRSSGFDISGLTNYSVAMNLADNKDPLAPIKEQGEIQAQQVSAQQQAMKLRYQQNVQPITSSIMNSPDADKLVAKNPSAFQAFQQWCAERGLDPEKPSNLTVANAQQAAWEYDNKMRSASGLDANAPLERYNNVGLGNGEIGQINTVTGKKNGDLIDRQNPTYTLTDVYDPATNTTRKVPIQSGGFGMTGVNPSAVGGGTPKGGVDIGVKPPSDAELKSAEFAGYMKSGINGIQALEQKGYVLSPKARSIIIDAATAEGDGLTKQYLKQVAMKAGLSPRDQEYMSALMPVLQAAGHSMAGARMTESQMKTNFESLIPVDVKNADAMSQIQQNRNQYYKGLLTQSGSAVQMPQYSELAADLKQMQQPKGAPKAAPQSAIEHLKGHPELRDASDPCRLLRQLWFL